MDSLPVTKSLHQLLRECALEDRVQENKIRDKARIKAKSDLLMGYYKELFKQSPQLFLYKDLDDDIIPIVEQTYRNSNYAFVTINMNEAKWNKTMVLCALNKKPFTYIKNWIACIEYYTENGHHPHIHLLLEKDPKHYVSANKSKIIKDFHRRFNDFVDGVEKIDVRMPKDPNSKFSYIAGNKKDPVKRDNHKKDVLWRQENGLADLYGNWSSETGLVGTPPKEEPVPLEMPNVYELSKKNNNENVYCDLCDEKINECQCCDFQD